MKLTVDINPVDRTASLVERHSLAAGDTYNPLVLDFSRMSESELASVDTGSLVLVVYRSRTDRTAVASANMFSVPSGKKSLRTAALQLTGQAMRDWYASAGGTQTTCYLEIGDSESLYVACELPVILRDFSSGGTVEGYYTSSQVDALLAAKQAAIEAYSGLAFSGGTLSLLPATASRLGGIKVGSGLAVQEDGTLSADIPSVDSVFDTSSPRAVQNGVVAAAVSGLADRLSALDDASVGRVKALETAMEGKAASAGLARVATTGSYNDLSDTPAIPSAADAAKWRAGTGVAGTSAEPAVFSGSGVASANAGDMYLNVATGNVYSCTLGGNAATAKWRYEGCIRGAKGDTGDAGAVEVVRSYESVLDMNSGFAVDGVPEGGLVVIDSAGADGGKVYRKGASSYAYLASLRGPKGDAGQGARWLAGTGVTGTAVEPTVFQHSGAGTTMAGDMYLNTATGNAYRCVLGGAASAAQWSFAGSLVGAPGEDGADGTSILVGTAVSSASTFAVAAKEGDLYFNSSSGDLYRCGSVSGANSTWELVGSLVGPAGADGKTWLYGSEVLAPGTFSVDGAAEGNFYLGTNGSVYRCVSVSSGGLSTWALVVDLAGDSGADGSVIHSGVQVAAAGSGYTILGAKEGDFYLNTTSRDLFRCASAAAGESSWALVCNLSGGVVGPEFTVSGYVPSWNVANGTSLGAGYYVATSMPVSALAGAGQLITAGAVYAGIEAATSNLVSSASHTENWVPLWASGKALKAGYPLRTEIRPTGTATNSGIPTEAAVRAACAVIETRISQLRIDELVDAVAGSVACDATQLKHGLMSSADKARLDGLVDLDGLADVGEALADADTMAVKRADTTWRKATLGRLWTYVASKLPSVGIDTLGEGTLGGTRLDATTARHGLCPQLTGDQRDFLRGDGQFAPPTSTVPFVGTDGVDAGEQGLVPAPAASEANRFLCSDGTWKAVATAAAQDVADEVLAIARYDTVFVPAGAMCPGASDGASPDTVEFTGTRRDVMKFGTEHDDSCEFDLVLPDDWDEDVLRVRFLWTVHDAEASAGTNVTWAVGCVATPDDGAISVAPASYEDVTDELSQVNDLHRTAATSALSPEGTVEAGSLLHFTVKRIVSTPPASPMDKDALLLGVWIQYARSGATEAWV